MHAIPRWGEVVGTEHPIETDLEHVYGIFSILDRVQKEYPNVYKALNIRLLYILIAIHDLGEGGRGDLPNGLTIDKKLRDRIKKNEIAWGKYFLQKGIGDEQFKKECIDTFMAYEFRNDSQNKKLSDEQKNIIENNALTLSFMKWLDYAQAIEKGIDAGFAYLKENQQPIIPIETAKQYQRDVMQHLSNDIGSEFITFSISFIQQHNKMLN